MISKLGDIATIRNGQAMKETEKASEEAIQFITIKNIESTIVNECDIYSFSNIEKLKAKVILKKGDIIIPARGNNIKAMYINDIDRPLTINNHLFLIRSENNIDSKYLFWFFNTDFFLKLAQSKTRGTTVPQLSISILNDIDIKIPSNEIQNKIGNLYYTWVIQKKLYHDLIKCGDKMTESFGFELIEEYVWTYIK